MFKYLDQFKQLVPSIKSLTSLCEFGAGNMGIVHEAVDRHYERQTLVQVMTKQQPLSLGPPTTFVNDPPSEGKY